MIGQCPIQDLSNPCLVYRRNGWPHIWLAGYFQQQHLEFMLLSDQLATCCIAALMVIFTQVRKLHLPLRDHHTVSSVLPINRLPCRFVHRGRSHTVDFNSTQLRSDAALQWAIAATPLSVNYESTSSVQCRAASGELVWNQQQASKNFRDELLKVHPTKICPFIKTSIAR